MLFCNVYCICLIFHKSLSLKLYVNKYQVINKLNTIFMISVKLNKKSLHYSKDELFNGTVSQSIIVKKKGFVFILINCSGSII